MTMIVICTPYAIIVLNTSNYHQKMKEEFGPLHVAVRQNLSIFDFDHWFQCHSSTSDISIVIVDRMFDLNIKVEKGNWAQMFIP